MKLKVSKQAYIVIAVIAAAIVALGVWKLFLSTPSVPDGGINKLSEQVQADPGTRLSEADIAAVNKTEAFYNTLATVATQSQLTAVRDYTDYTDKAKTQAAFRTIHNVGFDYGSKELTYAQDSGINLQTGVPFSLYRCDKGLVYYMLRGGDGTWREDTKTQKPCAFNAATPSRTQVGDGFSASGLTVEQAAKYIGYLRDKDAFQVHSLSLADHEQKQYLMYKVRLTPKEEPVGGTPLVIGLQYMLYAVRDGAAVDTAKLPFTYIGDIKGGLDLVWYVDPKTKLPVYGEFDSYEPLSSEEVANSYRYKVSYLFGEVKEVGRLADPLKVAW